MLLGECPCSESKELGEVAAASAARTRRKRGDFRVYSSIRVLGWLYFGYLVVIDGSPQAGQLRGLRVEKLLQRVERAGQLRHENIKLQWEPLNPKP